MTDDDLKKLVAEWRASARDYIRRYAAACTPHVSQREVTLVADALGEVSVDEAKACLDRLEREAVGFTRARSYP
jgi:ribosomal protein L22